MKFTSSILLISAALGAVASAVPLVAQTTATVGRNTHVVVKRCTECTHNDNIALDLIVKASADHYSSIAHARLNNLMTEIEAAKVTSDNQNMPQEKAALSVTVQTKIDEAKKACEPEALAPVIKASVTSNANLDIAWSKKEEIEKKMAELDLMITKLMLERIQANINAEMLSKDCTENMTNTEIAPAPAPAPAEQPAPAPEPVAEPAPVPAPAEQPAPAPAPAEVPAPAPATAQPGIDVAANVDSKFVCKSGCKDSNDAKTVLTLRVNLENEFSPRLDHFYGEEVPAACEEKRESLLGGVLQLVAHLNVDADAKANA
ncbi:hypothetical protein BGZ98_009436 [Dissophora globulifera]|nr:hypothetical protein BGZ98_009436 [Dissophora globulifera]